MISLARLKRLDISAHNPKMFSKPSHGRLNSPQDVSLKSSPADVQVSARNRPLVNCQNCSRTSWVWSTWTVFPSTISKYYSNCVKEMKRRNSTFKESERCKLEVLHEANILHSLGDHAGLPFRLGIYTEQGSYCLVIQFHGCGEESLTLHKEIKRRLLNETSTLGTLKDICGTLENISTQRLSSQQLEIQQCFTRSKKGWISPDYYRF